MDLHLTGRRAIVTGASKGIGLAVTRALAAEGAAVAAGALHGSAELDQLAGEAPVHPITVDLSTPEGPRALVDAAVDRLGGIDLLVNNVGAVRPRLDGFLAVTDDDWAWTLTINLMAAVRTLRAAIPHLLAAAPATIVTVCSVNASLPDPTVVDYSAAKAALANLSKALSKEYAGRGLRINTVSPGPVETDLWLGSAGVAATIARAGGASAESVATAAAADSPTGRFTSPGEVADLVVLLASDRAGNITGSDVVIDGGLVQTV